MDKPLSQERLSGEILDEILGMVEYDLEEGHQISWGHAKLMFDEIKRLQAIEIQQKKVIEFCTTNLTAYGLKSIANEAKKMLEGVNDHE